MSEGQYWPGEDVEKYGQIEPVNNFGGGGGGSSGGWGGGSGGGGDEVVDADDWEYLGEPREFDADFYAQAHNDMPQEYGDKFHTWHGVAVTEYEFDRLRHDEFVAQTGGRQSGFFGGFSDGWEHSAANTPRAGIPQFQSGGQARLSGGRSAARLPGANFPRMSAPNYPQLSDGGGLIFTVVGVVLGGIARVFGWK
jgi:hypothetical protein